MKRPEYFFSPPQGFMNDPIPFYHNGMLHLFYQVTLDAKNWSAKSYGHSVSRDGVHFETRPMALTPGAPYDSLHCYTGSVIQGKDGRFCCFYTGVNSFGQNVSLAESSDLDLWHKAPDNPCLTAPEGYDPSNFRDPCVYQEGAGYKMLVGARNPRMEGEILCYSSADLRKWRLEGIFYRDPENPEFFECPDYFEIDGKKVLLFSRNGRTFIAAGTERNGRFIPEKIQSVEAGGRSFYAGRSYADSEGRRFLIGWIPSVWSPEIQKSAGWGSLQSIPLELHCTNGKFQFIPKLPPEHFWCLQGQIAPAAPPMRISLPNEGGKIILAPDFLEVQVDESHFHRPFLPPRASNRLEGNFSGRCELQILCDRNVILIDWNHEIIWIESIWSK